MPMARARAGSLSSLSSTSAGFAQIDTTGVDTASGSPLRSKMVPRDTAMGTSRRMRASAWFW